jgi:hypothetical protein
MGGFLEKESKVSSKNCFASNEKCIGSIIRAGHLLYK